MNRCQWDSPFQLKISRFIGNFCLENLNQENRSHSLGSKIFQHTQHPYVNNNIEQLASEIQVTNLTFLRA